VNCPDVLGSEQPVVGMVHLPALPGAPQSDGELADLRQRALADARALERGGVDALLVENYGDVPFHAGEVPRHTVAFMSRLVSDVAGTVDRPVGVSVLWNDGVAAVSVAAASGASFVRIPVHTGRAVSDTGVVEGRADETVRLRDRLGADVAILADVDVKHASAGTYADPAAELTSTVDRGLADGVVVTGAATGRPVPEEWLRAASEWRARREDVPVLAGSGVTPDTVEDILDTLDGAIVGTALKRDGETTAPVDVDRVAALVGRARE
jgi:membrane complex biogenesis BtpA family protein